MIHPGPPLVHPVDSPVVVTRLTLEGCGELYAACRRLAGDFQLRVEVWDGGRQLVAFGSVHDMLFVDQQWLGHTPLYDAIALHNLLLRIHRTLGDAVGAA